jgi:hypothetical protein
LTYIFLFLGLIRLAKEWRNWQKNIIFVAFLFVGIIGILGALGPIIYWMDGSLGNNAFHAFLYHYFPGYEVIRIPWRWFFFALFGISVFSAWAAAPLLARVKPLWQYAFLALFTIWILFEQSPAPIKTYPNFMLRDYPVYNWLAEDKEEYPIVELPIYPGRSHHGNDIIEARRMYFSTFHWKKRASGAISPYVPDSYIANAGLMNSLGENPEALQFIINHRIRYVIFFPEDVRTLGGNEEEIAVMKQRLDQEIGLEKVHEFPESTVYAVKGVK